MENVDLNTPDDDDEVCGQFVKQGKRSRRMVISDDDDDEQDNCEVVNELVATVDEDDCEVVNELVATVDEDNSDVRNTSLGDPDLVPQQETLNNRGTNGMDDMLALSSGADSDNESVQYDVAADIELQEAVSQSKLPTSTSLRMGLTCSDIFDDEISDGDSSALGPNHEDTSGDVGDDRPDDNDNSSDDDVANKTFDDSQVDPSLLAKLKRMKGASKSGHDRQKYSRKAKPTADKMLEIYSESQRLLRDSRVNLPYHEPESKQLEDFLARAVRKQQEYAGLHRRAPDIQKARIICDRLSSSPHLMSSSNKRGPKFASSQRRSDTSTTETSAPDCQSNQADDWHPSVHMSPSKCISKCLMSPVTRSAIDTPGPVADDELPDLCPVSASLEWTSSTSETVCDLKSQAIHAAAAGTSTDDTRHNADTQVSTPLLRKDLSRDLFKSQNSMIDENLEQPQSLQGQDSCLQTGGLVQFNCTADNMTGRRSSCEWVNVSGSPSLSETVHSRDSIHIAVGDMNKGHDSPSLSETVHSRDSIDIAVDDMNKGHDSGSTPASYISQAAAVAECSSQSLITATACSHYAVGEVPDSNSVATPVGRASRHKLLDRLQGFSLAVSPSLSATPDGVVCLDDAKPAPVVIKPGLMKLMNRLVEHSKNNSTMPVASSILDDRKDQVPASVVVETEESAGVSGYKLDRLKQQLGVGMREKRAEARQRRYNQFALDNEQGFGEEEEEGEVESEGSDSEDDEETDKTKPSDSEDDEDEDCNINMEAHDDDDDDDDYIPYLDQEALDDDDDEQDKSSDVCLHFDVSDEEEHTLQDTEQDGENKKKKSVRENKSNADLCTSEEDNGEESRDTVILPRGESASRSNNVSSDEDNAEAATSQPDTARHASTDTRTGTVSPLRQWSSETSPLLQDTPKQTDFRRENSESPDLYSSRMDEQNLSSRSQLNNVADTNVIKYLDDDGFIRINETQQTSKVFLLPQTQHSDDLEGIRVFETTCPMSAGHIFHGLATQDSGKGDNQMVSSGLGSGSFVPCASSNQCSLEEDDDDVIDPFHVLSESEDDVAHTNKEEKAGFTDSDDDDAESEVDDDGHQCERDDTEKERSQLSQLKKKRSFRMTDFVEDEAELSGSEYDSDENVDVAEEDDILEEEAGDLDLQGVSEEKLRDEVGKLHMKQLRDDDDRALMRYKEMYLQDGDLYSEGAGRIRNFRWKDVDHQSEQDRFGYNSDNDQAEEEAEDAHWRKDRFEREKFLEEKQDGGSETAGQVIKLGQFFLKKQESIPSATDNVSSLAKSSLSQAPQLKIQRKGSFLSRGKGSLGKIAEVVQTTHAVHAGQNSRNFLFQTVDGSKGDDEKTDQPQSSNSGKRKAHPMCTPDTAKKAKHADTSSATCRGKAGQPQQQSSIFDLFTDT